jgi:hypothetical protein
MSDRLPQPSVNEVGDLVLTEPQAMLALAEPFRMQLFDRLRREGPLTVAELGADDSAVRVALKTLATAGLVHGDGELWHAAGKGFVFEIPDDPAGRAAGRALARTMFLSTFDLPCDWLADAEPQLPIEWARASGALNARVALTADELRDLQRRLDELLAPYLTRDVPPGAAPVRILGYFMPEPPETRHG